MAQFAQNNFKFKTYTVQDGLVHNFTLKSRMDSKGFLWIITQNGLSRFDGCQFNNFQNIITDSTSLPYNELTDIDIDASDRIWLAYDKGLCYYDQANSSFYKLKQTAVSLCYDSRNNKIWFNNYDGLFELTLNNFSVKPASPKIKYPSKPLYTNIDSRQRVWVSLAEHKGYYVYDTKQQTCRYHATPDYIRNIKEDNDGSIWLCTWWADFQKYDEQSDGSKNLVFRLPHDAPIKFIFQDAVQSIPLTGPAIIWVATHTSGIALFDKGSNKFIKWWQYDPSVKSGIATDFNSSIYTDPNGIVWICTWKGLTKVNRQEQQFQSEELKFLQSDGYNLLTGIMDDPYKKDFAWIGVDGTGVCYYNKAQQKPVKWYYSTREGYTDALYNWIWVYRGMKDARNVIWFANAGGLIKIDKGRVSKEAINIDNHPCLSTSARLLPDGFIWLNTNYGLIKFNPVDNQYKYYKHINADNSLTRFQDVIELNADEICCASDDGLFTFNRKNERFLPIRIPAADTTKKDWTIFYSLEKIGSTIYAGSASGLLQYDIHSGNTKVLGKQQEIFNLLQHSLLKDTADNLWIYTLHGLFKYSPAKNEFKKFTAADGIYNNSSDPVQMFTYNNNIYIGYRMAYTRFDPMQVDVNNNTARPFINSVSTKNNLSKIYPDSFAEKPWQLGYSENNIQVDYTAIDYTNSEKITFAYMLEGFDKDWVNAGTTRKVNYSNLKGGNYVFKLKACNSSGLWNENYTSFKFYIRPPLWQRWWFWPLSALLFVSSIIGIARNRIKKIRQKEKLETDINRQIAELEMKALRSQMNPHFIFNSLNSIHKYIWENKQDDASEYLTKFSKLMRLILENSASKSISLNKEIEALNLYTELEHRRSSNKFDYQLTVSPLVHADEMEVPPMIFQPYIENAVWHGLVQKEGKGNLSINFDRQGNYLICTIDDDGIGRAKAAEIKKQKQSFHRSIAMTVTAERLKLIQSTGAERASVEIIDKTDATGETAGTLIKIKLPITD